MRLAIVDLLFSWPPNGGADVDIYHVATALQHRDIEVQLFGVHTGASWDRGSFEPESLPFPATKLEIKPRHFNRKKAPARIKHAIDEWKPDAVLLADGFFLKPAVALALSDYPVISRYYAHEAFCQRDILRFKNNLPCPYDYLTTPDLCRRCALERWEAEIRADTKVAWLEEYLAARAFDPAYHQEAIDALKSLRAAIVYNEGIAEPIRAHCEDVRIIPGGTDGRRFIAQPPPKNGDKKVIAMTGRGEDPVKGVDVLRMAGERLRRERNDFEIRVTMPEDSPSNDWFKPVGWQSYPGVRAVYEQADICVVPSVWDEPFGMVAVEAMAVGRPVCASRVGGLQDIVVHTETGFLFQRGDSAELAKQLALLLDNPPLRKQMGEAGRARVEEKYLWKRVVVDHYLPLLESL